MRTTCALALLILALPSCKRAPSSKSPDKETPYQRSPEIPVGKLGHRLGKYLTIEGTRAEQGKVGVKTLLVDKANGQEISPPVAVWIENIAELPAGTRCVLNGYESGKMIGIPDEVAREENLGPRQAGWQFYRFFIVTSVVAPNDLELN